MQRHDRQGQREVNRQRYIDRRDAGVVLAERLEGYRRTTGLLVLGLPRGGVPVAAEVALALDATLDVLVVRKVGVPNMPEVAMGAIASIAGTIETAENVNVMAQLSKLGWGSDVFSEVATREEVELVRRQGAYRAGRPALELTDRVVILVDDGLATGATARAAVAAARREHPARLVVAVPVGSREACADIGQVADDVLCAWMPDDFAAVGQAYENFDQTSDDEVRQILGAARQVRGAQSDG